MSRSRTRNRAVALIATVPVLAVGPFAVLPAYAADAVRPAALSVTAAGGYRLGPNAGFRGDTAHGVDGRTAIYAIDVPGGATLNSVTFVFDEPGESYSLAREFEQNGGFALYKDTDGDGRLDPDEYAAGAVSAPQYTYGGSAQGAVITVDATSAATGAATYLLTAHPAGTATDGRKLSFTIPAGGVVTSTGTLPASAVALPEIKMDSAPPALIPLTNFTAKNRAPSAADGYEVYLGGTTIENGEKVGFFNTGTDLSDAAVLTVTGQTPAPAIYDAGTLPNDVDEAVELSIGNGTGRDLSVSGSRALNNQISDDVWVQQWDQLGNVIGQVLTNTVPLCNGTPCAGFVPRGNDVTAPSVTYSVTMGHVTKSSTLDKVPVTGTVTGTDAAVPANTPQTTIAQLATPQHVVPIAGTTSYNVLHSGTEARSATPDKTPSASPQEIVTLVDFSDATKFPEDEQIRASARLIDVLGNATVPKTTDARLKDTSVPTLKSASLIDTNANATADTGEQYRLTFDDAMDATKVTSANLETALALTDPAGGCGKISTSPPFDDQPLCLSWGKGATVAWSGGDKLLTITLGTVCSPYNPKPVGDCDLAERLPVAGDTFTPATNVTDPVGNALTNQVPIAINAPVVLPYEADTVDASAARGDDFGTGRDGVLDAVDVKFTGHLDPNTVAAAAAVTEQHAQQFSVAVGGAKATVTSVTVLAGANADTIRVAFTVTDAQVPSWRTGARPEVALANQKNASTTGVTDSAGHAIAEFSFAATDKVAPVPLSVTTKDADGEGHIDTAVVQYTEGIDQTSQNPCGYAVTGYGDQAYSPPGAATPPGGNAPRPCPAPTGTTTYRNKAAAGSTNDVVVLTLKPITTGYDTAATPAVRYDYNASLPAYPADTSDATHSTAPDCADTATKAPTTASITASCPVKDVFGNALNTFSGISEDGAGPALVARTTGDADADGLVDRIDVTFSEDLDTKSLGTAQFEITAPVHTTGAIKGAAANGMVVPISEDTTATGGDTGVLPTVKFLGGSADTLGNASPPDTTGKQATDKAGPALMRACSSSPAGNTGSCPAESASDDKVNVFFSEAATDVALADFVVEQPLGTAKTATAASPAGDGKSVTLTFADGTVASNADGYVRLASAGAIKDAATNGNTQTSNVTISRLPEVTLDLTCPTQANPGYCGVTTVNTGASGVGSLVAWRLRDTPRGATPVDSEFDLTQPPSTFGPLTEGDHTLYLSAKDSFGRYSAEQSDTITILKAPKILNVQWVNATPAKPNTFSKTDTVLDGDVIKIGADAYGTDAAKWAANSAPTGGGCLVANLKINLSGLVGDASKSAVAPNPCNLVTGTEQPYRQLQWSGITAAGTTKYPVGTVLKTSTGDPGWLITDDATGKQFRRPFISVNARRSWQITDASVIQVPLSALSRIATGPKVAYRDGAIVKGTGTGYYYVSGGAKRPVSTATLSYWKIPTTTAYAVSSGELAAMPSAGGVGAGAHPVGVWIKFSNGSIQQVVRRGDGKVVRRALANSAALRTLVPTAQIFPANSKDAALPLDSWLRGYRDGTLLKTSTGYAVVARGALRKFQDNGTFNTLGYATTNALSANGAAMPRVNGQTYRTGAVIDRYKITSIVITVTNTAGASVQATVKPTLPGIYGVGTLDAVPAGWDFTRNWS
ncbi:MAG TPA: hypothetical protein VFQ85_06120 [Mycobacteriales bacterium]|jgi:hypothetical protein|nr:hypothetical protein [Mycobacteriales bacterium]